MTGSRLVELTRVQPFEAEVIAARLRSEGIDASLGPDAAVYESVSFADGVPVYVADDQVEAALKILDERLDPPDPPDQRAP